MSRISSVGVVCVSLVGFTGTAQAQSNPYVTSAVADCVASVGDVMACTDVVTALNEDVYALTSMGGWTRSASLSQASKLVAAVISSMNGKYGVLDKRIVDIVAANTRQDLAIAELEALIATNTSGIATNREAIAALTTKSLGLIAEVTLSVDALGRRVDQFRDDYAVVTSRLEGDVVGLKTANVGFEGRLAQIQTDLTAFVETTNLALLEANRAWKKVESDFHSRLGETDTEIALQGTHIRDLGDTTVKLQDGIQTLHDFNVDRIAEIRDLSTELASGFAAIDDQITVANAALEELSGDLGGIVQEIGGLGDTIAQYQKDVALNGQRIAGLQAWAEITDASVVELWSANKAVSGRLDSLEASAGGVYPCFSFTPSGESMGAGYVPNLVCIGADAAKVYGADYYIASLDGVTADVYAGKAEFVTAILNGKGDSGYYVSVNGDPASDRTDLVALRASDLHLIAYGVPYQQVEGNGLAAIEKQISQLFGRNLEVEAEFAKLWGYADTILGKVEANDAAYNETFSYYDGRILEIDASFKGVYDTIFVMGETDAKLAERIDDIVKYPFNESESWVGLVWRVANLEGTIAGYKDVFSGISERFETIDADLVSIQASFTKELLMHSESIGTLQEGLLGLNERIEQDEYLFGQYQMETDDRFAAIGDTFRGHLGRDVLFLTAVDDEGIAIGYDAFTLYDALTNPKGRFTAALPRINLNDLGAIGVNGSPCAPVLHYGNPYMYVDANGDEHPVEACIGMGNRGPIEGSEFTILSSDKLGTIVLTLGDVVFMQSGRELRVTRYVPSGDAAAETKTAAAP